MSALFTPLRVGTLELPNRIVIAPMCQYSAVNGCMTDWHLIHLGHLALSGAALLTIEATAVLPDARITYADVGLWNNATEAAIARMLESIRRWSDMQIAFNWRTPVARPRRRYRGKAGCRSHPIMQTAGRRSRRLRSRTRTASTRRSPSTDNASRGCVKPSLRRPSARRGSYRCRPAPRRARLSAAPVPLATLQPSRR